MSAQAPLWRRLAAPTAAAVIAGALVAAILWPRSRPDGGPVTRFALAMTPGSTLLIDPQSRDLAITPDGAHVVYKGGARIDQTQLFVYGLDQLDPRPLTSPGMPKGPFVSPDGRWVGFFEPRAVPGAALKKVAVGGGPALDLARLDGPSRGATWGDNGVIVAASASPATGLLAISEAGGELTILTRPNREHGESDHLWPHFLPGTSSVLFTITALSGGPSASQIAVLDLRSGKLRTILRGASQAHYVQTGHLVYLAGNALWAVPFDIARMEVAGPATMVVPKVVTLPTGVAEFDIARDGTLVYVARGGASDSPRTLVWVDRQGRETPIAAPPRPYANVRLSPDASRVAVEIEDQDQDIWVWDLTRETLTKVTTDPGLDETPVWTPDGRRLVFTSQAGGVLGSLFWQAADGSGTPERLAESEFIQRATAVLPDGRGVVYSMGGDLMTMSLDKGRQVQPLVRGQGGGGGAEAAVSPDGRWLAYVGGASGLPQIFVSPFSNPDQARTQVTPAGGSQPRWAANGRELFYTATDGTLMAVPVAPGPAFTVGLPTPLVKGPYYSGLGILSRGGSYDVFPDGQRFLMLKYPGEPAEPPTVVVVKNWFEELKRLVPDRE
jgi:serine/threonine-protein kinase